MMLYFKPMVDPTIYGEASRLPNSAIELRNGETIKAEVIDILPSGRAVVKIKDVVAELKSEIPLQKDTTLLLQVQNSGDFEKSIKLKFLTLLNKKDRATLKEVAKGVDDINLLAKMAKVDKGAVLEALLEKGILEQLKRKLPILKNYLQDKIDFKGSNSLTQRHNISKNSSFIDQNSLTTLDKTSTHSLDLQNMEPSELNSSKLMQNLTVPFSLEHKLKKLLVLDHFDSLIANRMENRITKEQVEPFLISLGVDPKDIKRVLQAPSKNKEIKELLHLRKKRKEEIIKEIKKELKYELMHKDSPQAKEALDILNQFGLLSYLGGMLYSYLPLDEGEGRIAFKSVGDAFLIQVDLDFEDGEVVATLFMHKNDLKVDLFIEDIELKRVIGASLDELRQELSSLGFNEVFLGFSKPVDIWRSDWEVKI